MKNKKLIYIVLGIISIVVIILFIMGTRMGLKNIAESPLSPLISPLIALRYKEAEIKEIVILETEQEEITKEKINITYMINIKTNKGDIKIELWGEDTPITVDNFVTLAKKGFYNGLIFHRVIEDFMIQGGCPLGTGMGGPDYTIKCEFTGYNQNTRGTIAMANAGLNTGGSQFFINLVDNDFLNNKHTVFGKVIEGMDIVDTIATSETGIGDRPIKDVIIKGMEINKQVENNH